jgi:hypothetical protein
MHILVQIVTAFVLMSWPMATGMSPMLLGAEGAKTPTSIGMVLTIVFCPVLFGLLYYTLDWSFLWFRPKTFLVASIVLPVIAFVVMGYPQFLIPGLAKPSEYGYAKKPDGAYYDGVKIQGADVETFETLEGAYARDKQHVYALRVPIPNADPATFERVVTSAPSPPGSQYWRDKHGIYLDGKLIEGADSATFRLLAEPRARDRQHVFYNGHIVTGADPATFEPLSHGNAFSRDSAHVYMGTQRVFEGADPNSLEILPGGSFAKDASHLFRVPMGDDTRSDAMPDVDFASFVTLNHRYAKDKNHVYFRSNQAPDVAIVKDADLASFSLLDYTAKEPSLDADAQDAYGYFSSGERVRARGAGKKARLGAK